jgi:hypothetical protein
MPPRNSSIDNGMKLYKGATGTKETTTKGETNHQANHSKIISARGRKRKNSYLLIP